MAAASAPTDAARSPVTLGVTEPFVTTFTVAAYAALLLALPFILCQIVRLRPTGVQPGASAGSRCR